MQLLKSMLISYVIIGHVLLVNNVRRMFQTFVLKPTCLDISSTFTDQFTM